MWLNTESNKSENEIESETNKLKSTSNINKNQTNSKLHNCDWKFECVGLDEWLRFFFWWIFSIWIHRKSYSIHICVLNLQTSLKWKKKMKTKWPNLYVILRLIKHNFAAIFNAKKKQLIFVHQTIQPERELNYSKTFEKPKIKKEHTFPNCVCKNWEHQHWIRQLFNLLRVIWFKSSTLNLQFWYRNCIIKWC